MSKIEKTKYEFHLTFDGFVKKDEMDNWYQESMDELKNAPEKFGILADLRTLKPLPSERQSIMEMGQIEYKKHGMIRSIVVLNNSITTMQFKKIGKISGIYDWECYLDASSVKNWETVAIK